MNVKALCIQRMSVKISRYSTNDMEKWIPDSIQSEGNVCPSYSTRLPLQISLKDATRN